MKKYPNVSVKIIFKYKSEVLMLKHKSGKFDFPGGRMEWRESFLDTLNRELKEELDYSLKEKPHLFDVWNYISKDKKQHTAYIFYIYKLRRKLNLTSPEGIQVLWLTGNKLKLIKIIEDNKFLNKLLKY